MKNIVQAAILGLLFSSISAFVPRTAVQQKQHSTVSLASRAESNDGVTRRQSWVQAGQVFGTIFLATDPALAKSASSSTDEADKQKILKGYQRLNYLLDNWERETSDCKTKTQYSSASSACERTPIKVMDYLGYKNTNDPLFNAEKTLRRLEVLVPAADEVDFLDAVETYREKADEGSGMAYISSWGEANPGGGKDRVELFIERAKNDVIAARDSLGVVIRILKIE